MERCGTCQFKKKIRSTTYYQCTKYNQILSKNPAEKCQECMDDRNKSKQRKQRKDYIEVK